MDESAPVPSRIAVRGPAARQPEPDREELRQRLRERIDRAEFEQLWPAG
jgi:hypothetical protein